MLTLPLLAGADRVVEEQLTDGGPAITVTDFGQEPGDPEPEFSKDPFVALVEASVLAAENGFDIPADLEPALLDLDEDRPDVGECEYFEINEDRPLCPRGDPDGDKTLVLIGDSHARQWIPALDELGKRYGYTAYFLVREGCPGSDVTPWLNNDTGPGGAVRGLPGLGGRPRSRSSRPTSSCSARRPTPTASRPRTASTSPTTTRLVEMYGEGMTSQVSRLAPLTDRVILIGDPPDLTFDPGRCLSERDATLDVVHVRGRRHLASGSPTSLRDGALAAGAEFVKTSQWFCADGRCPTVIGDYIARRDKAHVSVSYAEYLTDELEERLQARLSARPRRVTSP